MFRKISVWTSKDSVHESVGGTTVVTILQVNTADCWGYSKAPLGFDGAKSGSLRHFRTQDPTFFSAITNLTVNHYLTLPTPAVFWTYIARISFRNFDILYMYVFAWVFAMFSRYFRDLSGLSPSHDALEYACLSILKSLSIPLHQIPRADPSHSPSPPPSKPLAPQPQPVLATPFPSRIICNANGGKKKLAKKTGHFK